MVDVMYAGGVARSAGGEVRYVVGGGEAAGVEGDGFSGFCALALFRILRGEGAAGRGSVVGVGRHADLARHVAVVRHGVLARHVGIGGHVAQPGGVRRGILRIVSFARAGGAGGRTQVSLGA